jgi:hypothetical protein
MIPYQSRIPIKDSYLQAVGQAFYNFATAEWSIVYLGSLISPSFVTRESGADFGVVDREFSLLCETGKIPECVEISKRFSDASAKRQVLVRSIPITAVDGAQILDGSEAGKDTQWTEEAVWAFANELQTLDIDANALYYKLKPSEK